MGREIRAHTDQERKPHREMKNAAEQGKCTRCNHQDATHAHECNPCHRVTLCMAIVHSIWRFDELDDLADQLDDGTMKQVHDRAQENGAFLRLRLINMIRSLAMAGKIHPDDLKRKVVFGIRDHVREINSYRKWESKPGNAGKWMEFCRGHFAEVFAKLSQMKS